jgi:hypothetical protein
MNNTSILNNNLIFYTSPQGNIKVEVLYEEESFWLSQKLMAELFNVEANTINYHLKEIFKTHELDENSVIRKIRVTASDGKNYNTNFYNLDAVIAVGYRVNSLEATQFRIWATKTLKEFMIKGFILDDERLKQGKNFGKDYFDELLQRIQEIRASERRFYLKITDIYEQCSIDYNKDSDVTRTFFQTVQNKLHYAITQQTAAEIIHSRANADKPNMGLTTWKNAPSGKILKSDVSVAKNYLIEKEIDELNRIVSMYLDYAENQAKRQIAMNMQDWITKLGAFLQFNEYDVLENSGKISQEVAKKLAYDEYEKFRMKQDIEFKSDFENIINILDKHKNEKN